MPKPQVKFIPVMLSRSEALRLFVLTLKDKERESMKPIRVLCARESVHRVLADQITNLGLDKFYEVQVNRILGVNGTSFSFEGVKNNVNKIKSYEGIDYCWVEEANREKEGK